jgi:hypothetical protein
VTTSAIGDPGEPSQRDKENLLAKVVASPYFITSGRPRQVLEVLFAHSIHLPGEALSDREIASRIGLSVAPNREVDSRSNVRNVIGVARTRLQEYRNDNPGDDLEMSIENHETEKGYFLEVDSRAPKEDFIRFLFEHRGQTQESFQRTICGPSNDLLFLTIGSQHTLAQIEPWFESKLVKINHFRVLMWRPKSASTVKALGRHLFENPDILQDNIEKAWKLWKKLENKHQFVQVARYVSTPTMQGICDDSSIKVELLPFNRVGPGFHECGSPNRRPALMVDRASHRGTYRQLRKMFEDLWRQSIVDSPPKDVHERWREARQTLLLEVQGNQ